ncbi:uncharacterized protein METZ01_LOCUS124998 [marine metagenome]|uniref:Uncharacterized protein n=1 Tax=marine metagenome TaxID=408172 RepID=A0A381Y554_9ZZZZ
MDSLSHRLAYSRDFAQLPDAGVLNTTSSSEMAQ